MVQIIIIFMLVLLSSNIGLAMNDTNGVVDIGLFPLNDGNKYLQIQSEKNEIAIKAKGIEVIKSYQIYNLGKRSDFELGTMYCYNCVSNHRAVNVTVNGKAIPMNEQVGYLIDAGESVKVEARTRESIAKSLKHNDGNISGHVWASFKTSIESKSVASIELRYFEEHPPENLPGRVLSKLSLYSEKFWSGKTIPKIDFILSSQDNIIPIKKFITDGTYDSLEPDTVLDDKLIWSFKDYEPRKSMYTYSYRFVHPYSVDCSDICKTFNKNTGAKIDCSRSY